MIVNFFLDNDDKMINEIYKLFGEIFENAQYIEWNIALIVSKSHEMTAADLFEKMQDMTMGQIVSYAKNVEFFDNGDISELEYILDKRNYLAHHFFKQNDIVKHSNNAKFLENKIRELQNILTRFQNYNGVLSDFYRTNFRK